MDPPIHLLGRPHLQIVPMHPQLDLSQPEAFIQDPRRRGLTLLTNILPEVVILGPKLSYGSRMLNQPAATPSLP